MTDISHHALTVESIGGACPFQAYGKIFGCPFYFRARHGGWTMEIARPGSDPVCNPELYFTEGEDDAEGWMETVTGMIEITKAMEAFRAMYFPQIFQGKPWPIVEKGQKT